MKNYLPYLILTLIFFGCSAVNEVSFDNLLGSKNTSKNLNKSANVKTLSKSVIDSPKGFVKVYDDNDFGIFLRNLPFKTFENEVKNYDGSVKQNTNSVSAVINLPITDKNKQTYSNGVFRLRNEYLFDTKKFNLIKFDKEEKPLASFNSFSRSKSYSDFLAYLDEVYDKLSPSSLANYTHKIPLTDIKIGDIFYQNSSNKSHAVMIIDLAENLKGKKIMLLAQTFYPSQELHVISNPENTDISPWYEVKEGTLLTPDWRFFTSDLVRFN